MNLQELLTSPDRANIELAIAMEEQFTEQEWKEALIHIVTTMEYLGDEFHNGDKVSVFDVGLWKVTLVGTETPYVAGMIELCSWCVSMVDIIEGEISLSILKDGKQELITAIKNALRWS